MKFLKICNFNKHHALGWVSLKTLISLLGSTSVYICVEDKEECPSNSWMVLKSPPADNKCVANECLNAWGVAVSGSPNCFRQFEISFCIILASNFFPFAPKNKNSFRSLTNGHKSIYLFILSSTKGTTGIILSFPPFPTIFKVPVNGKLFLFIFSASEILKPHPYNSVKILAFLAAIQGVLWFFSVKEMISKICGLDLNLLKTFLVLSTTCV